jgi:hypothetical protein
LNARLRINKSIEGKGFYCLQEIAGPNPKPLFIWFPVRQKEDLTYKKDIFDKNMK